MTCSAAPSAKPAERTESALLLDLPSTPLTPLKSFPGVWLKCEHQNPTGSHKDRAYCSMVKSVDGSLEGRTLVDYTTGNGGISLAWLAGELGVSAVTFMPEGMTMQRETLIRNYGARLVLTPADGFVVGARAAAEEYVRDHPGAVLLNQSDNLANECGLTKVGLEMVEQCHREDIRPGAFVCAIGTGGSFSGIARVLKSEFGDAALPAIGIEAAEAPIIWAKRRGEIVIPRRPSIIGMGAGKIARNTDERIVDDIELAAAKDVLEVLEALSLVDGFHVGPSTAANVMVAHRVAQRLRRHVVTMSFDRGNRYV